MPSDDPENTMELEKYLFEGDDEDDEPTTEPTAAVEASQPNVSAISRIKINLRRQREQSMINDIVTRKKQRAI